MKSFTVNKPAYRLSEGQSRADQRLLSLAFIVFLFVTFVGLTPFAERIQLDDLGETGEGDMTRQLIFISLTLLVSYLTFFQRKSDLRTLRYLIPVPIIMVLGWCAITLLWSPVPLIGLRRLGLTALIIFAAFVFVQGLGSWRTLRLMALCLLAFVMASLISGPIVPSAVHLSDERDEALVGAWRGIFEHKNQAGVTSALCMMIGYYFWRIERRKIWLIAMLGSAVLLILSKSKTPLGLLIPALLIGLYYEKYFVSPSRRKLLRIILFFVIAVFLMASITFLDQFSVIFDDPDAFTGRVAIWETLIRVILDNPLGGVGFSSIYDVGNETPLADYASGWVYLIKQGHNGYLDVISSTGLIGFSITIFSFVIKPLFLISQTKFVNNKISGLLVSIIFFIVFYNLLESRILNRDEDVWVSLVIICAITQLNYKKSQSRHFYGNQI